MLLLDSAVFDAAIDWLVNGLLGFSGWQIFFVILFNVANYLSKCFK